MIFALALSASMLQAAYGRESALYIKSCQVNLPQDWIISEHVPNGDQISLVAAFPADAAGRPAADKAMLVFGYCDVENHLGLTRMQLLRNNAIKTERQIEGWETYYKVEAKKTDFGFTIDAFQYLGDDRKAYLWVRMGHMVETKDYMPADADYEALATHVKRIKELRDQ